MFKRIVTHNDFDGISCAAVLASQLNLNQIIFTGPRAIIESQFPITMNDVVCDLPYPLECGMWFDHHIGNLEDVKYRGIDPDTIPGKFDLKPSCARVVYDYLGGDETLPLRFKTLVDEADIIDSFNFGSIEDWRKETPAKIIDSTLRILDSSPGEQRAYLNTLVRMLSSGTLYDAANSNDVQTRYRRYKSEEQRICDLIRNNSSFCDNDTKQELIIIDLTHMNKQPVIIKNMAYLIYPKALGVLLVQNAYNRGQKTNDLQFSMALSLNLNTIAHQKNAGEIMRALNLGDGHNGAAAGIFKCRSKDDMLKNKERILTEIWNLWKDQPV